MMRHAEVSIPAAEEQDSVDARVTPTGSLENLSQQEVDRLLDSSRGGLYELYRRCSRMGEVDDLTGMCLFLLSDQAKWVTGQIFNVDGGQIIR